MSTKNRADVILQVLINLGKLGNDAAPAAEDSDKVDRVIDPALDDLSARNIFNVPDAGAPGPTGGAIDNAVFLDVCDVVALRAAPAFNMAMDEKLLGLASLAESRLEIKAAPPRSRSRLGIDRALRGRRPFLYNNFISGT